MQVLLGTYTKKDSKGIYSLELDESKKECIEYVHYLKVENPTYLCGHGANIFSVCSKNDKGGVAYFKNGVLMQEILNQKVAPCYVSYDQHHHLLFSANYHQGMVNSYKFVNDQLIAHQKIVYPEGSKAHYIKSIKDLNTTFVCDLGLDKVYAYTLDEDSKLVHKQTLDFDHGSGPRHIINHPSKSTVYVLSELSYEIFIVDYNKEYKILSKVSANPTKETTNQHGAAIRISKDGKFLYTSNRTDNSLSVFKINTDSTLELIQHVLVHGRHPRDFDLSPDQKFVLVANLESDNCTLFERDEYSGKLTLLQKDIYANEPVCVLFR